MAIAAHHGALRKISLIGFHHGNFAHVLGEQVLELVRVPFLSLHNAAVVVHVVLPPVHPCGPGKARAKDRGVRQGLPDPKVFPFVRIHTAVQKMATMEEARQHSYSVTKNMF